MSFEGRNTCDGAFGPADNVLDFVPFLREPSDMVAQCFAGELGALFCSVVEKMEERV